MVDYWLTFVSIETTNSIRVADLLYPGGGGWHVDMVSQLLGLALVERVLAIVVPIFDGQDVRVWSSTCTPKVMIRDLYEKFQGKTVRRMDGAWI